LPFLTAKLIIQLLLIGDTPRLWDMFGDIGAILAKLALEPMPENPEKLVIVVFVLLMGAMVETSSTPPSLTRDGASKDTLREGAIFPAIPESWLKERWAEGFLVSWKVLLLLALLFIISLLFMWDIMVGVGWCYLIGALYGCTVCTVCTVVRFVLLYGLYVVLLRKIRAERGFCIHPYRAF
jgi:hypothetical protein